ncbi:MAG: response regulator [Nitrosomonas sp.]|nr:response regulator [Nitrosomonas sp.]MBK7365114.1 response regulator [Nitrosomonas sp.]
MPTTIPLLLIVDDSRTSRMLIRKQITHLRPNWQMIEASSGEESLSMIKNQLPDFISMDVNMPGISGLEAADHIRFKYPEVRIVLCTANIQESIRNAVAKANIGFVSKPITERSVTESIAFWEQKI